MPDMTNADRSERARLPLQLFALQAYGSEDDRDLTNPESFEQAVGDLLGNLHHYVQQQLKGERRQEWSIALGTAGDESVHDMLERLLERGFNYYRDELLEQHVAVSHD